MEENKEVNTNAEEAANQTASADEPNKEVEIKAEETADPNASEGETNTVDYAAEYLAEKERREKAENKIVEFKRQFKEGGSDVDTKKLVEDLVNAKLQDSATDLLEETLNGISDENERKLVKYHYENSIRHTGFTPLSIQKDVDRARLLANEKKILKESKEMKIALKAQNSTGVISVGSNQDKPVLVEESNLSELDKRVMQRFGLTIKDIKQK